MPDTQYRMASGALVEAAAAKTRMAGAKMRQLKAKDGVTPNSTRTYLEARECDYDGYSEQTLTTWGDPVLGPVSGWMIVGPQVTFLWTFVSAGTGNEVVGYWVETAGGDAIDLVLYDPARNMLGPGNSITETPVQVFPASAV